MKDIIVDTNNVTKNDYPELEGKFINYYPGGGVTIQSVVIGCNRQLGITVVAANDKNYFQVCFAGPILPDFHIDPDLYDAYFDACVKAIQSGEWICRDTLDIISGGGGRCSGTACAYSR